MKNDFRGAQRYSRTASARRIGEESDRIHPLFDAHLIDAGDW